MRGQTGTRTPNAEESNEDLRLPSDRIVVSYAGVHQACQLALAAQELGNSGHSTARFMTLQASAAHQVSILPPRWRLGRGSLRQ